ncbi:oligosaccharide flippase family protein [Ochrovirga pacifica]|uniref:oligosaccharide flippase family protein n=1 Tax=Ochrovirga pacifica TaxID=1042376 RepID=UPI0002559DA1|nr:oligosaccharide flippase family protein [Ochrovirga pacifica]
MLSTKSKILSQENLFMLSALVVNGGNYLYNLLLGRILGPAQFSDAAILITMLLILSFVAMTFQLVVAKFSVTIPTDYFDVFVSKVYKNAAIVGIFCGAMVVVFAPQLQELFHTTTANMFTIFGIGIPLYFFMSVNRGMYQGKKEFKLLSITYQTEMLSRLGITLLLVFLFPNRSSEVIALGVLISLFVGLFPFKFNQNYFKFKANFPVEEFKNIRHFFAITAFYELSQIIINNSDILLVKHYFEPHAAGLYASLALIGRIVYFIAWMFVMLLLPTVVQLKKEGKKTAKVLAKYVVYISVIAFLIIIVCKLYPVLIVQLLFGNAYVSIAPLMWKYAFATGVFAVANIFAYYFLSLDRYLPVVVSAVFGGLQVLLIFLYHNTLEQVVHMQMIAMFSLLLIQLLFFTWDSTQQVKKNA